MGNFSRLKLFFQRRRVAERETANDKKKVFFLLLLILIFFCFILCSALATFKYYVTHIFNIPTPTTCYNFCTKKILFPWFRGFCQIADPPTFFFLIVTCFSNVAHEFIKFVLCFMSVSSVLSPWLINAECSDSPYDICEDSRDWGCLVCSDLTLVGFDARLDDRESTNSCALSCRRVIRALPLLLLLIVSLLE